MKTAILGYQTKNIGDDLQSFSVLNISNSVDAVVDRDCLGDAYLSLDHQLVLNTWFKLGTDNRLPSKRIKPIFYGFALGDEGVLDTKFKDYMRQFGPIGCRDTWTVQRLHEAGIEAYWTCCSSIFAGNFVERWNGPREGIYNFDVPVDFLKSVAPESITSQMRTTSNHVPPMGQYDQLHRFSLIDRLLRRLASAELVLTRRLHIALPCIGLGTPVLFFPDERLSHSKRRASGVETMIPLYFQREVEEGLKVDWSPKPAALNKEIAAAYEALKTQLAGDNGGAILPPAAPRPFVRLSNARFGNRPGRIFLSMPGLEREVRIEYSCDEYVDTDVRYFPGLERFTLKVLNQVTGSFSKPSAGYLKTLGEFADRKSS